MCKNTYIIFACKLTPLSDYFPPDKLILYVFFIFRNFFENVKIFNYFN